MRLVEGEVDFVVVGGIAAVVHGSVGVHAATSTSPMPPTREPRSARQRSWWTSTRRLRGVTDDVPFVPDGRTLRHTRVLTLDDARSAAIDLLAQPDGSPVYETAPRRARGTRSVAGVRVQVASLEDLIAMKKAAGRLKDLVAVEELEAIQRLQRELD